MTVTSQWFQVIGGTNSFSDPSLAYITPLRVCVEGGGFTRAGTAANRSYKYYPGEGKFEFLDNFPGDPSNDLLIIRLFVKYKY